MNYKKIAKFIKDARHLTIWNSDGTYGNCTRTINHGAVYRKNDYCSYAEHPLPEHDDHTVSGLLDN